MSADFYSGGTFDQGMGVVSCKTKGDLILQKEQSVIRYGRLAIDLHVSYGYYFITISKYIMFSNHIETSIG